MYKIAIVAVIVAVLGTIGVLGYTFRKGIQFSENKCEAETLEMQLKQKEKELAISKQLSEFQQEQLDEAQKQLTQELTKNDELKNELDAALAVDTTNWCITPGMRDAIKKYRSSPRGKSS